MEVQWRERLMSERMHYLPDVPEKEIEQGPATSGQGRRTVPASEQILSLLQEINGKLARVEALVDIHLGQSGTLEKLKDKVDGMHTKMLLFSGGAAVVLYLLNRLRI
jgi:hypothetical protein